MSEFVSEDGLVLDYDYITDAYVPQIHVIDFFDPADPEVGIFYSRGMCNCGKQFDNMADLWRHVDAYDFIG